jgi:uncharacterized membrane protein YqaE (UPF0057 family)
VFLYFIVVFMLRYCCSEDLVRNILKTLVPWVLVL